MSVAAPANGVTWGSATVFVASQLPARDIGEPGRSRPCDDY
jgi:hypothetical protein